MEGKGSPAVSRGELRKSPLTIAIGGITSKLVIDDDELNAAAAHKYGSFASPSAMDCLTISVSLQPRHEIARSTELEVVERPGGFEVRRHDLHAVVDADFTNAELTLTWPEFPIVGLDCFVRLCYSVLAVRHGALLLHSAGVIRNGGGWAFPGTSGSGKSTAASFSIEAGGLVLSDEISLVRRDTAGWAISGTPFHGDLGVGANQSAPLSGLLFLRKSDGNEIERLGVHDALKRTSRCTIFFSEKTGLVSDVFEMCCEIASTVPCYELRFRRDSSFWQVIDGLRDG